MREPRAEDAIVVTREVTILNELGLHAACSRICSSCQRLRSEIWIVKDGQRFSAASLIDILRANLDKGATAVLEAKGRDAEAEVERLARLLREFKD
jgi:phosphocarrier protein